MSGLAVKKFSEIIKTPNLEGVKTAKIVKVDQNGSVFIHFKGNPKGPIKARVTAVAADSITQRENDSDLTVLIAFEENDLHQPVVIDVIHDRIEPSQSSITTDRKGLEEVKIDGETVTFEAKKEIVLRCGKASVTLTKAGKVLIRGAYLLNRSSGVNRIKGGLGPN
jgi:hypothetical protein